MFNNIFNQVKSFAKKAKERCYPITEALDTFTREPLYNASSPPFVRDSADIKRWMTLVVMALMPAIIVAIWNAGMYKVVYSSSNAELLQSFYTASNSLRGYFQFAFQNNLYITIIKEGLLIFLPLLAISYGIGGLCEVLFSVVRKHEIAEGLLVTGILYPLTLPPTIPYWMAALGIAFGVIIAKEVFGGTGMNIFNPALAGRAFLFFTFPSKMTGDIWIGRNPYQISKSLYTINASSDGFSQASCLSIINSSSPEIKKIHIDAIAAHLNIIDVKYNSALYSKLSEWAFAHDISAMSNLEVQNFLTSNFDQGGLGLSPTLLDAAYTTADAVYGTSLFTDWKLFLGNMIGSLGETSSLACLMGAIFLVYTGIASWRIISACGIGALVTAWLFKFFNVTFVADQGAWMQAKLFVPAYRHLILGGLAFGMVFMATDPVSAPSMNKAKWLYGLLIGSITVIIRYINPAYSEGVMLAILFGNAISPLLDFYACKTYKRRLSYGRSK